MCSSSVPVKPHIKCVDDKCCDQGKQASATSVQGGDCVTLCVEAGDCAVGCYYTSHTPKHEAV